MNVQEIIAKLDEMEAQGRVREFDYYQDQEDEEAAAYEDGFVWIDEIDKWVKVD